jgi:hypothetical protein
VVQIQHNWVNISDLQIADFPSLEPFEK